MGINRPRWTASNAEIIAAAEQVLRAADILKHLASACELLATSLDEVQRYRKAMAAETAPLDWGRFVEEVRDRDPHLAAALDGARPARFALGDCSLCVEDGRNFVMLNLKKDYLTETLSNRYGTKFRLSIRQQK